jgi:putative ABC transport system substrate-binding protein
VAIARYCLSLQKKFSIRWRALYSSLSKVRWTFRLVLGGITSFFLAASRGSITRSSASRYSARAATSEIPIISFTADPVAVGLVSNIARPEGNITGVTIDARLQFNEKRMQLLKAVISDISTIHFLSSKLYWGRPAGAAVREAAKRVSIAVTPILLDAPINESVYRDLVDRGGLMAYSVDLPELCRRITAQVAQLLNGARPQEILFFHPIKFQLIVNMKAAQKSGISMPQMVLARADEVIE